jgi:hypothetical protein
MIATLPCNPYHEGNNAIKKGKEEQREWKRRMELV